MKLLLDTHVWVWWLTDPTRLSRTAELALRTAEAEPHLSAVSTWELVVKAAAGRASFDGPFESIVEEAIVSSGVIPLPVEHRHALRLRTLPPHHRDPFDRMLIAQAQVEGLTLVSADSEMGAYDVPLLW